MNLDRAQLLLRKIDALSSVGEISKIEQDLILNYLRELYELYSFETPMKTESTKDSMTRSSAKIQLTKNEPAIVPPPPPPPPPAPKVVEKAPVVQEVQIEPSIPEVPAEVEVVVESVPPPEPKVRPQVKEVPKVSASPIVTPYAVSEPFEPSNRYSELFEIDEITDISQKLEFQPIADLTKHFSINEKLLTIKTLFNGDQAAFVRTVNYVNKLDSFRSAKDYLSTDIVDRYEWNDPKRFKTAKVFIKSIYRRFL